MRAIQMVAAATFIRALAGRHLNSRRQSFIAKSATLTLHPGHLQLWLVRVLDLFPTAMVFFTELYARR